MKFVRFSLGSRTRVICAIFVLGIIAAAFALPFQPHSKAAKRQSHKNDLPNYDIRSDKAAANKIAAFRLISRKTSNDVGNIRDTFVQGVDALKRSVPTLKVEYNTDIRIPEVIAPDVKQGKAFLTSRSPLKRHAILTNFLEQNADLIGAKSDQIDQLKVAADYTNPDGNLSFVELDQEINGIPVFRGEVKAGFSKDGEMIRVINNFAPGLDYDSISTDFGDPVSAVMVAAASINSDNSIFGLNSDKASNNPKIVFGKGDSATTAEKMYFPTEPGVAIPAWRVLIWQPINAYYVIVDAQTGTMLWRKNLTEDQTQAATYSVYANPNAMINVAHSPFPLSPGPASPNGAQGSAISRTPVTRIGNEPPYTFNNLGWIPDGVTITDGNAVQAGLDRDFSPGPPAINDGVDLSSEATSSNRDFTFAYNPFNPNTNTGDAPVPASQTYPGSSFQQGVVTELFYICNLFHDETYRLGFTEAARNFQNVNFTGQGVAGDRVRGEGQDSSGTNNSNFTTAADGVRGRMQMYIFSGPNPNVDGILDTDVVVHEHTHGLSQRLHGNSSGLTNDMSRGMGEGWSDFFALSMLSQASDPVNGVYAMGPYSTYNWFQIQGGFANNNYYGVRRFPYAIRSATGGPINRPFNPLTFADIDQSQIDLGDGAFARGPLGGSNGDEVHNAGEIWCSALWEVRAKMVTRLGWSVGNRKVLQLVTDGMKLAPLSPTFLQERDAIIAAGLASDPAGDVSDIWDGFATRGMGASAVILNVGGTSIGGTGTTSVGEAFDLPNLLQTPNPTISDPGGNGNSFADPGETIMLGVPLTNQTGHAATNVTIQIGSGSAINAGTIASGTTSSPNVSFTVPAGTSCGSVLTLTINVNSSLGPVSFTRTLAVGSPTTTFTQNFDAVTPPAAPAGWSITSGYGPMTFVSTANGPDNGTNSMFAADLPDCTPPGCSSTDGGSTELTSPVIPVSAPAATVTFRHKFSTEGGWDGGVLEISIAGGDFADIITAGGTFIQNGYNGQMGVSSPNPLGGRNGWTGNSNGYITTVVRLPAAASGQNVQLRWRFGADSNGAPTGGGWNVDTIDFAGAFACSSLPVTVSGRVMSADGRGLRNTIVNITGPNSFVSHATTSSFGFYQFQDIPAGQTYTVSISSRLFRFAPQTVEVSGNILNLDFIGLE